jgi:peptidoglycan hydrolase-like protein with peptidoglycan-binding domain
VVPCVQSRRLTLVRKRAPRQVVLAVILALALTGCGGEADTERQSPNRASAGETETAATTGTIRRLVLERGETVGPGSKGDVVRDIQQALALLGYDPGPIDGDFGPATRKAVIAFQKDQKLTADGVVGPQTAAAINEELERKQPAGG